jgi:hypothetical protein
MYQSATNYKLNDNPHNLFPDSRDAVSALLCPTVIYDCITDSERMEIKELLSVVGPKLVGADLTHDY